MDRNISNDRLVKNEVMLRDKNLAAGRGLKKYFRGDRSVRQSPIAFLCECSAVTCDQVVSLSIDAYEKLHERNDRFVIFPGHATEAIEKTVAHQDGFDVVEKYVLAA